MDTPNLLSLLTTILTIQKLRNHELTISIFSALVGIILYTLGLIGSIDLTKVLQ